jgi:hypothetical protein
MPVKTIIRTAGDGQEGFAMDGLQARVAPTPTPTPATRAAVADFNNDGHPDYALQKTSTRQTGFWYLNNNVYISSAYGPTLAVGWALRGVADFDVDSHPDYALFAPSTNQTAIWYLSGATLVGGAYGPILPSGWELVATADFNADSNPDYVALQSQHSSNSDLVSK